MAQPKGYLVSQNLLNQIRETNRTVDRLPNQTTTRYVGDDNGDRYLVKITGKYTGSNFASPTSASYAGVEVVSDSAGVFSVVSGGIVWGDDTDSASWPPIIDLRSLETINGNSTDTTLQRIQPDAYVEVFQRGNDSGDTLWYTDGLDHWFDKAFGVDFVEVAGVQKVRVHGGQVYNDLISTAVAGANFAIADGFIVVRYTVNLATGAFTVITPVEFVAGLTRPDEFAVSAGVRTCKIPIAKIVSGKVTVLHHGDIDCNQDAIRTFELFPVNLTGASGSAGSATTQAAFTYTVSTIGGVQLLTTATPVWNRPAKGKLVAGTSGTAYFNDSNVCIFYQADEVPFVAVCP